MGKRVAMGPAPISAIGMMEDKRQRRYVSAGFSLLEVLVVIVIIAIVFSFAVLTLDTEPDKLDNETQRLTALMKLVAEEAVMNSRDYRLLLGDNEYSFQVFSNSKWRNTTDDILRRRQLPEDFSLSITIENQLLTQERSLDGDDKTIAAILFLSSDEATPFELSIIGPSGLQQTISNLNGLITTSSPTAQL